MTGGGEVVKVNVAWLMAIWGVNESPHFLYHQYNHIAYRRVEPSSSTYYLLNR